ncbi:MAG: histidine kinase [Acidimicrobiales bacterium]
MTEPAMGVITRATTKGPAAPVSSSARLAWGVWAVTAALAVADLVLALASRSTAGADSVGFPGEVAVLGLVTTTVGALIASRVPANAIGWLFCVIGLGEALAVLAQDYAIYGLVTAPGSLPGATLMAWCGVWLFGAGPVGIFVLLLFPDGRLPSRRWRPVAWLAGLSLVAFTAAAAVGTAPPGREDLDGFHGPSDVSDVAGLVLFLAGNVAAVAALAAAVGPDPAVAASGRGRAPAAQVVRVRLGRARRQPGGGGLRSTIVERRSPGSRAAGLRQRARRGRGGRVEVPPLRHRHRHQQDGGVRVVGRVHHCGLPGHRRRHRGRRRADRHLGRGATAHGHRGGGPRLPTCPPAGTATGQPAGVRGAATPYEVLSGFSQQMALTPANAEVLPRMATALAEGSGATHVEIWLRVGAEIRLAASWPDKPGREPTTLALSGEEVPALDASRSFAVRHREELLGVLAVTKPRAEPLTGTEEKLISDLASQAGLVLRNVRLTTELADRLEEISVQARDLQQSRQRIVAAQDQARYQLERNLHDGAQQQLVALMMRIRLAEEMASEQAPELAGVLAELKSDTRDALENLRDLARGIYPPTLAHQGLVAALRAQAAKAPIPVEVDGDIGRYEQGTEVAVYFSCLEALQNVSKYAQATGAEIRLWCGPDRLSFSVADDGVGFDAERTARGSGLEGVSDRLAALGGGLRVDSAPGSGTTVTGWVPVGEASSAG